MGIFDSLKSILGTRAESDATRRADPEDLFGMSTAYITMEADLGYTSVGEAALCFSSVDSTDFAETVRNVEAILEAGAEETGTGFETAEDDHGYHWVVLEDPDFEDLVVGVHAAADAGAAYVQTPEMTGLLERSRTALFEKIREEDADETLAALREAARARRITVHVGSLAIRVGEKVANRAVLIGPDGAIVATYDKIHLFDVDLADGETWRESATYVAGARAVLAHAPIGAAHVPIGVTICYDIRFPALFEALGRERAEQRHRAGGRQQRRRHERDGVEDRAGPERAEDRGHAGRLQETPYGSCARVNGGLTVRDGGRLRPATAGFRRAARARPPRGR